MNNVGRSIETIRRFDIFKRLVALGLFIIAVFAYVENLRAVPDEDSDIASELSSQQLVQGGATIDTPNNSYTAGDQIKLTGTGVANTEVAILLDSVEVERRVVGIDGSWTMQFEQELDPGLYQVSVVAFDENGNTVQKVKSRAQLRIIEGEIPPTALPTMAPPEITNEISRTIRLGEPLMLSGEGVPGTIVIVFNGLAELGKAIVGSDGIWAIDLELEQAGDYNLMFAASDANGVQQALGERIALTILAPTPTEPTIRIDDLPADFMGGEVTISGEADRDTVIGIVYDGKMFDVVATKADGTYSYPAVFDTPGDHT
ncbi:MAG: Ig-like domain-containing protein, partial [Candidatus Promineifilaceae bacterium]